MKYLSFYSILDWIDTNIVWGIPLLCLILIVGIVLSVTLKGMQLKHIGKGLKAMVANEGDDGNKKGEVSTFGALCISMAATLGTGKIVGVSLAIAIGGPGALFWMIIAALLGMATKYAEGFLAIKYRDVKEDGTVLGGPFMYIEKGMGKKWSWLAKIFAVCAACAGALGIGTMTQMNSILDSVTSVFDPNKTNTFTLFGQQYVTIAIVVGIVITIVSAIAVIGGIKRIEKVSMILVPIMAIGFFVVCLLVVLFNITSVPSALLLIVKNAFSFKAVAGGTGGAIIAVAMREGISKGIFSNEAGLGSAPIALASSKSQDAVRQGLVCMASTFIDTMVLCLTIGLGVVITGAYQNSTGVEITISAFEIGLHIPHQVSAVIVMLSITTFAFTTIIGWNVYGEKCFAYLFKGSNKAVMAYKFFYIAAVAIAPFLTLSVIWKIASIFNGLMALPNLIAILYLSKQVSKETNEYFDNLKSLKKYKEIAK